MNRPRPNHHKFFTTHSSIDSNGQIPGELYNRRNQYNAPLSHILLAIPNSEPVLVCLSQKRVNIEKPCKGSLVHFCKLAKEFHEQFGN